MSQTDVNRNLVAALSYLLGFITGIVILFVEKDDKFIRFHAVQSTLVFIGLFLINLIIGVIFEPLGFLAIIGGFLDNLIFIVFVTVWVISMFKAFQGKVYKWPIVGKIAENWVR